MIEDFFEKIFASKDPVLIDISNQKERGIDGRELEAKITQLSTFLLENNITYGDRVIAIFENNIESALLLLTAMRYGITLCIQQIPENWEQIQSMMLEMNTRKVVNASRQVIADSLQIDLKVLENIKRIHCKMAVDTEAFTITYTSGSTGKKKGIVHCAKSYLECAQAFNEKSNINSKDRFLNVMPMHYMAGIFNGLIAPLAAGAIVIIDKSFNVYSAINFWRSLEKHQITSAWLSPTMLAMVMRLDRTNKRVPISMQKLFIGTGSLSRQRAQQFRDRYGLTPLQSYGLSELLFVSVDDINNPEIGTSGQLLNGVKIAYGAERTLVINSKYKLLGHFVDGRIIRHNGLFQTSDIAKLTTGNKLIIEGRSDDTIIRGGVNVNPTQIEALIEKTMQGRIFCILGLKDNILGHKVGLIYEGNEMPDNDISKIKKDIRNSQLGASIDAVIRIKDIPISPTGKIRRAALRSKLENLK